MPKPQTQSVEFTDSAIIQCGLEWNSQNQWRGTAFAKMWIVRLLNYYSFMI